MQHIVLALLCFLLAAGAVVNSSAEVCWRMDEASDACQTLGIQCPMGSQCSDDTAPPVDPEKWKDVDPEIVKLLLLSQQDWKGLVRILGPFGVFIVGIALVGVAWAFVWWRVRIATIARWDGKCARVGNRRACKSMCPEKASDS